MSDPDDNNQQLIKLIIEDAQIANDPERPEDEVADSIMSLRNFFITLNRKWDSSPEEHIALQEIIVAAGGYPIEISNSNEKIKEIGQDILIKMDYPQEQTSDHDPEPSL